MALRTALIAAMLCGAALPAFAADEIQIGAAVSVERNAMKPTENSCALTFLVINGHPSQIEKLV